MHVTSSQSNSISEGSGCVQGEPAINIPLVWSDSFILQHLCTRGPENMKGS